MLQPENAVCAGRVVILGVETNLDFQYRIMKNPEFCEGNADTGFIERLFKMINYLAEIIFKQ